MTHLIKGLKSIRAATKRQKTDRKIQLKIAKVFLHATPGFGREDVAFGGLEVEMKKAPPENPAGPR